MPSASPRRCRQAIALYLQRHPDAWREVAAFFSAKRDLLLPRLAGSGLDLPPAQGTYFQLADYSRLAGPLAGCNDVEFTERLINEAGVAVIPLSPFYREPPAGMRIVRLCVAKRDETLIEAAARISAYTAALEERCRMSFRVSIVQQPLVWQDAAANRAHFAKVLAPLAGTTDLVVLPEMFTTGFTMKPEEHAEAADGPTRAWLLAQARALDAAVGGSVAVQRSTAATSTASCSRMPGGLTYWYDKRHLFRMGGEHRHYSAGDPRAHRRMARRAAVPAGVLRPALSGVEPAPARARIRRGRSTPPTGRRRAASRGARCCARAPSRTRPTASA